MEEEIVEKARGMGWMPLEEFKGNPDRWRPADEFVQRGENYVPILKDRVKKLEEDLSIALKVTKAELADVKKQGYEQAKAEFEKKTKELDEKELEAVETQDVEKFTKIKKEREGLKAPEPVEDEPIVNPVFEEWNAKNKWYGTDPDLTEEANVQFDALVRLQEKKTPGVQKPPEQLYAELEKRVKSLYPDKFKNPHREEPGDVEGGDIPPAKKGNTFSDLPKAAKDAYERQRKHQEEQGRKFSKEDYLKIYNED